MIIGEQEIGPSKLPLALEFLATTVRKEAFFHRRQLCRHPIPVHSGLGGAYYFLNSRGENAAIVKPTDEEPFASNNPKYFVGKALGQPGLKRSVRVRKTGFREVAAYLLDYEHFANVPPTFLDVQMKEREVLCDQP
ncbi:hypothetical protein AHAS_Ahas15G0113200 [Arachis hypogaea]